MSAENEQYNIDLESRLAFQEHSLQELHDLVAVQQKQLYDLEEMCKLLLKKINSTATNTNATGNDSSERPPHY